MSLTFTTNSSPLDVRPPSAWAANKSGQSRVMHCCLLDTKLWGIWTVSLKIQAKGNNFPVKQIRISWYSDSPKSPPSDIQTKSCGWVSEITPRLTRQPSRFIWVCTTFLSSSELFIKKYYVLRYQRVPAMWNGNINKRYQMDKIEDNYEGDSTESCLCNYNEGQVRQ